jgi:threonine/homoserine/homoserine lactone efflux protein
MFTVLVALSLFVFGVSSGFISSTPLGPINLLVANHYLSHKKLAIIPFIVGIILADVLLAFAAFMGYQSLLDGNSIGAWVGLIGGVLVIAFGVIGIVAAFNKNKTIKDIEHELPKTAKKFSGDFFKGMALCGLNPGLLLFWVSMASLQQGIISDLFGKEVTLDVLLLSVLLFGITLGEILWFMFFIKILKYGAKKFSDNILFYLRVVISAVLVLLGFYLLIFEGILKI